jgi:hypothetical protein
MSKRYNPADWYWIVAGNTTQVYSSSRDEYVPLTDATYLAWLAAGNAPTNIDTAANLAIVLFQADVSGLQITSTSTAALNGIYSVSSEQIQLIEGVCLYILMNSKFPGGSTTMNWPDIDGAIHTFPSTAVFQAFATAIADYVNGIRQYINSGGTLPSSSVTII